ncbi:hypothetical protein [Paenibacillus sp. BC26]|uniref:hypothetical protein n=1 Tax=Paenibacillus sp. BC26 TaxID=1881032 RepID=UPI0008E98A37|nr:hypothetical protein [Paenibacillus sp. BC26]SFS77551.1 hypothetical protein SAMN05428962_2791 [Paenibacillus sp. BC26]
MGTSHIVQASVQSLNSSIAGKEPQPVEPVLRSASDKMSQLLSTKGNIDKKINLNIKEKILSEKLTSWKEYNNIEGENAANPEVSDDRMVWVISIDCPNGVQTRGGFFKNAVKTYVIDAETEKLIEMHVKGDRVKNKFVRQVKIK